MEGGQKFSLLYITISYVFSLCLVIFPWFCIVVLAVCVVSDV